MVKVIAVVNQKGGVGKTTTAVNLASSLSVLEKKTLIIDLDPQGNATTGLGINKDELKASVYDLLFFDSDNDNNELIDDIIIKPDEDSSLPFLDVVPSNDDLVSAEYDLFQSMAREYKLKNAIAPLKNRYSYIIIDCPPSLSVITLNALAASDSIIIPIQCEFYALEGLAQLLNTIRTVQKSLNSKLEIEGALLTMYDGRLNLSKEVAKEIKEFFSGRVFNTVINRNVKLSEAPSSGKPILEYDIVSSGSENYFQLAEEIININKDE